MTILALLLITAFCAFILYLQDRRHAADRAAFASERLNLLDLIAYKEHLPAISEGIPKATARGSSQEPVKHQVELPMDRMRRETEEARATVVNAGYEVMN